jgi:prepilin-type N-terminal cleavage/methylation domain-containing protein
VRQLPAKDHGFTLFELLIVMVMVGILAVVGIPSLIGIINAKKVQQAQEQVQGILRGAQRQAIRRGNSCEIQFNRTTNPVTITNNTVAVACLTTGQLQLPKNVKVVTSLTGNPPKIAFNFKGRSNKAGTIVFYSDQAQEKRCLVISLFLGMMRSGNYTGTIDNIDPNLCNTTANTL